MKRLSGTLLILCLSTCFIVKAADGCLKETRFSNLNLTFPDPVTTQRDSIIKIDTFGLEIIPPSTGVQFYKEGIVFLSHSKVENKMLINHISFGTPESCYAMLVENTPANHQVFSASDPYAVPSDGMTFNSDFTLMYYAKQPKQTKDPEKIYQARYQFGKNGEGVWVSDPDPINICNDNSTYTHPALSASGEMLVFSSNRRGSSGGFDLYLSRKNEFIWSEPENLGKNINTNGSELFPFLDKENNLYYSSDGLKGNGGYDIYICKYNGNGWDKPVNLSGQINTSDDELALTISPKDEKSAFFTTRLKSDKKSLKLHIVTFKDRTSLNKYASLTNAFKYISRADQAKPVEATEPEIVPTAQVPVQKPEMAESVKKEVTEPVKKENPEPAQARKQAVIENVSSVVNDAAVNTRGVVYRVQFLSYSSPKGKYKLNVGDKTYMTFEYLFNGLYRSCAGEFSSLAPARALMKIIKQEGYTDAFVVAFKDGVRSLDPALFK